MPSLPEEEEDQEGRRREFWRSIAAAVAQGLSREALVFLIRDVICRGGPWLF